MGKYIRTCRKRNASHPDRGRQRRQHTRDRRDAGPQPVQHQPGDQAYTWFRPTRTSQMPVPAEKTEAAGHGPEASNISPPAQQGRPQEIQATKALTGCRTTACGAQVVEWLGCGWSPPPVSGRLRVLWPDDAPMRVCPETIYRWVYSSRPAFGNAGRGACREGTGGAAGTAAGGRRASRSRPSAHLRNAAGGRDGGARSAIGRPTASSEWDATHTRERRTSSSRPASFRDKTAGESVGAQLDMFSPLPAGGASASRTITAPSSPTTKGCATGWAWPRTRRPVPSWQRWNNENRNGMIRRHLPKRCEIRMDMAKEVRRSSTTRSTTAPCACSATARPPRRSPTNC